MEFPLNVYALAFATACLAACGTLPLWRAWARWAGLVDDPGHRKIHAQSMPLGGGLAVATGLVLPLAGGWFLLNQGFFEPATVEPILLGYGRRGIQLIAILIGGAAMLALGHLDDRVELGAGVKLLCQLGVALLVAAAGLRVTVFVPSTAFSYAATVIWILAITNAVNFLDNMDGLCSGLGMIASWTFAWVAAVHGQYLVSLLGFAVSGALLGFLPFNFPRATIFLGDSGSHLVGYLLAIMGILPNFYTGAGPWGWAVLSPLLILSVPLADLAQVVWVRWRSGRPVYVGDTNHLSHRLVQAGSSRTRSVLILWLVAAACGWLAVWMLAPNR